MAEMGVCTSLSLSCAAFMAEFHKMSAVINGLATTCAMEDKDCK